MNKTYLTILLTLLAFSGCSQHVVDPDIDFKPPEYVEQLPSREIDDSMDSQGSLFGSGDNPLFSDHKAMHVNDIVTVVISETATSSSSNSKNLAETDTSALGGGLFTAGAGAGGTAASAARTLNRATDIGFASNSTSSFNGSGQASQNNTFTTTVSARVIKILSNGNYFISGRREILVDGEKQIIQLSGVIRPFDINQGNQINSSQMADAKIMYKTEGDIKRATEQGWGTKLVKALWPF
jgi:flagellar L-ring protein precursor FlgH